MNLWRIDLILAEIFARLGTVWLVVAILVLLYTAFGKLVRALMATIFVLVCTQVWWWPLYKFSHELRWALLLILFVRGVLFVVSTQAPPDEEKLPRRIVMALGGLALASVMWSDAEAFTISLSVSFCLGLFVIFGLLWRLSDDPAVIRNVASGALIFAAVTFGAGFAVAAVAYATNDHMFYEATKLDWGGRYSGVFYNPNAAGLIGAMLLPIILAAPREFLGRLGWLRVPVFLLTFATIFLSGSRSALIGSSMAVVILGMYRYGAGALLTVALGAISVWALTIYAPLADAELDASVVGHISRTKHLSTLSGRLELWESGWEAAQGHLLIGQGWGKSRDVGGSVDLDRAIEMGQVVGATNLHNAHLQLLIDVGLVGVALFWAFCAFVMRAGWRILVAPRSPHNGLALVLFTSALALIADTWVHGAIWSMGSPTTLAFWGVCALSLKEATRARRESVEAADAPLRWTTARAEPAAAPA